MRRVMFLFLLVVLLIPTQLTFAQTGGSDIPAGCEIETVLDNFVTMLMEAPDPESAMPALEYLVDRVTVCGESWLMALFVELEPLISELMGSQMGTIEIPPDLLLAPDDGVLTSDEAEYAINQVFAGNLAEGNQFLCEDEQISVDEAPPFASVNEVSCQEETGGMSCYIDAVVGGEAFNSTVLFQIEDGRLCANETLDE